MSPQASWHEYQEQAAGFFRDLGLTADVDASVSGAKGKHRIDVYVTFDLYGLGVKCRG